MTTKLPIQSTVTKLPIYSTETFTPAHALKVLDDHGHEHNRPISQAKVRQYASAMKSGKWLLNAEPIIFGRGGGLLDGHHRLWSCVEAEVPFTTAVARGVDDATFSSIDQGKARSTADVIFIGGAHKHHKVIATAALLCMKYEARKRDLRTTSADINDWFGQHQDLQTWVERATSGVMRPFGAPLAAVLYLASPRYRVRALEFVGRMVSGDSLERGSPVLALRNRLLQRGPTHGTALKENTDARFALVIQGWNAFIDGRPLQRMQTARTEEPFNKIKGSTAT